MHHHPDPAATAPRDAACAHGARAADIVLAILRPVLRDGGTVADVMVLLESVVVGVHVLCIKPGRDGAVLDTLVARLPARLAEARAAGLAAAAPRGRG
jgi:hypothetical protein